MFPLLSAPSASVFSQELVPKPSFASSPFGVPSVQDWENMWSAWDFITRRMIPPSMLFEKPIDLRHICLFYLGHIPTFLDIHMSRLLEQPHTEPEEFKYIFEVTTGICDIFVGTHLIIYSLYSEELTLTSMILQNAM